MKYHLDKVIVAVFLLFSFLFIANQADANSHTKGRILLQVESHGEAWYVNPVNNLRYYMGRPADAFEMMRGFGLGATTRDINNFKVNLAPARLEGRILLQVESRGEAYYINPVDRKLYYLGRPADAFATMRNLGLGITNANLITIPVGSLSEQRQVYRIFNANEFEVFYNQINLPHLSDITVAPSIFFHQGADARIVSIARSMDYRLQKEANIPLQQTYSERLQLEARNAFLALQEEARRHGFEIGLVSGYRSIDQQRNIFVYEMEKRMMNHFSRQLTANEIALGQADDIIEEILETISIPGFSKHHTGYAIDINDASLHFTRFGETEVYQWLAEDNFFNAKRFGFIPSYTKDATNIGPNPEPWEYVWVGTANLLK